MSIIHIKERAITIHMNEYTIKNTLSHRLILL